MQTKVQVSPDGTIRPTVVEAGDSGSLASAAVFREIGAGLLSQPALVPALEQRQLGAPTLNVRHERHRTELLHHCLTAKRLDMNEADKETTW